jgi:hypothetical protein
MISAVTRNLRHGAFALLRRAGVVALLAAAFVVYGLVAGGPRVVSFQSTAASSLGTESGLSVSEAISPTNQSVNVAARGPNNSLRFYWQVSGTWYGPLGLGGANTTYSAPSIAAESNGNFDIAVEGPGNSMYFYWDTAGTWYGPLQVAATGSTFSTPALDVDTDGHLALVVEGPGNTLYHYWNISGAWYGPLGIGGAGTTFSAPSISVQLCSGDCSAQAFSVGPGHDMRQWQRDSSGNWSGPREWSSDQQAFSAPSSYGAQAVFEGANHSLATSDSNGLALTNIGTGGSAYSAPSLTGLGMGTSRVTVEGPLHTLSFWSVDSSGHWGGPVQVGGPGSTYSAPSMEEETGGGTLDLAVQGPGDSLYAYWNLGGTWYGPLQVAGAGTTFGSSN